MGETIRPEVEQRIFVDAYENIPEKYGIHKAAATLEALSQTS